MPSACAETISPLRIASVTWSNSARRLLATGRPSSPYSGSSSPTSAPERLNSLEMMFSARQAATAKETSVGGTCICSNEPLMESLPPMAAASRSSCAISAPSSAAIGRPHFSASPVMRWKYSWKVRCAPRQPAPQATSLAMDETTDRYAPT